MKKVFKYPLMAVDSQEVGLPDEAEGLSVHAQHGQVCLWALVDDDQPTRARKVRIVGTGHDLDDIDLDEYEFIGSVLMMHDALVWHIWLEH